MGQTRDGEGSGGDRGPGGVSKILRAIVEVAQGNGSAPGLRDGNLQPYGLAGLFHRRGAQGQQDEKCVQQTGGFLSNHHLQGKAEVGQYRGDIIGRVALLICYGIIRMAERRRVCGRWLTKTGLSVGGVCLEAFGKHRDPSSEALATRSLCDFGREIGWHAHCDWLPLF